MASWRPLLLGLSLLCAAGVTAATLTSPMLVLPPVAAAALVLLGAALAVDYFGIARRREGWGGFADDPRHAWARARALEVRFARERGAGSPRCAWTARSLLLSLAAVDRLDDAAEVVDFLGADAIYARVGADPVADALRAVALAELGRTGEARELSAALQRSRRAAREPVVAYAAARVCEAGRRHAEALEHVGRGLRSRRLCGRARRDLEILRARLLSATSRVQDAAEILASLAARGHRREVEQLGERAHARGDSALALAARQALCEATPYR
jgi:hypothetical protein